MRVVIRLGIPRSRWSKRLYWPSLPGEPSFQTLALALSSLLGPCSLIAFTLTFWSIAADLRWMSNFFVSRGLFSHWQIWLVSAAVLLLSARVLSQFGDESDTKY